VTQCVASGENLQLFPWLFPWNTGMSDVNFPIHSVTFPGAMSYELTRTTMRFRGCWSCRYASDPTLGALFQGRGFQGKVDGYEKGWENLRMSNICYLCQRQKSRMFLQRPHIRWMIVQQRDTQHRRHDHLGIAMKEWCGYFAEFPQSKGHFFQASSYPTKCILRTFKAPIKMQ
jgi:hypothetical protein